MPDKATQPDPIDDAVHRRLAADLFNRTWELIERPYRTADEDDAMVHAAHASRHHWGVVGDPKNLAIGEWQCSRVYAVLGRAEPALHHARRSLAQCEHNRLGDFVLAYAHEAMARAHHVAGDAAARDEALQRARRAAENIADADDRALLDKDLSTIG